MVSIRFLYTNPNTLKPEEGQQEPSGNEQEEVLKQGWNMSTHWYNHRGTNSVCILFDYSFKDFNSVWGLRYSIWTKFGLIRFSLIQCGLVWIGLDFLGLMDEIRWGGANNSDIYVARENMLL